MLLFIPSELSSYLLTDQRDFIIKLRPANKYEPFKTRIERL